MEMMVALKYRQMRYKKGEKEAMRKAGFPWCYRVKGEARHCNSCIKRHRAFDVFSATVSKLFKTTAPK